MPKGSGSLAQGGSLATEIRKAKTYWKKGWPRGGVGGTGRALGSGRCAKAGFPSMTQKLRSDTKAWADPSLGERGLWKAGGGPRRDPSSGGEDLGSRKIPGQERNILVSAEALAQWAFGMGAGSSWFPILHGARGTASDGG